MRASAQIELSTCVRACRRAHVCVCVCVRAYGDEAQRVSSCGVRCEQRHERAGMRLAFVLQAELN